MGSYLHHRNMLLEVLHLSLHSSGYVQGVGYITEAFLQLVQSAPVVTNITLYLHGWGFALWRE